MKGRLRLELTLAEAEALMHFIATRKELWRLVASECGVENPENFLIELASEYAETIKKEAKRHELE